MVSITVKNIPDSIYSALKELAVTNHRSVNSEIIHIIEKAALSQPFDPEQHLRQARRSRNKTKGFLLTDTLAINAKNYGRP
jgi:plasmid stability protein